jgi:hypothetical protein
MPRFGNATLRNDIRERKFLWTARRGYCYTSVILAGTKESAVLSQFISEWTVLYLQKLSQFPVKHIYILTS